MTATCDELQEAKTAHSYTHIKPPQHCGLGVFPSSEEKLRVWVCLHSTLDVASSADIYQATVTPWQAAPGRVSLCCSHRTIHGFKHLGGQVWGKMDPAQGEAR